MSRVFLMLGNKLFLNCSYVLDEMYIIFIHNFSFQSKKTPEKWISQIGKTSW